MRHVLDQLVTTLGSNTPAVLATIIRHSGSTPRTSGARMLVTDSGILAGSVGGGAIEGSCRARAQKMLADSEVFAEMHFQLTDASTAEAGMVCGGSVSLLLLRLEPELHPMFADMQNAYHAKERPFLVTVLPSAGQPPHLTSLSSGQHCALPAETAATILRHTGSEPFPISDGARDYFIEPLVHPGTVYLAGAGHVALATASCAVFAGFEVVVIDDRADFANRDRFPHVHDVLLLTSFDHCLPAKLGADDYVVIVTRGHLHDRQVLAQTLKTDAGYIGMIGSRRKRAVIYQSLRDEGFTDAELQRVHCPIGLAIGADTPEEIGLSIVAELVQTRAGKR